MSFFPGGRVAVTGGEGEGDVVDDDPRWLAWAAPGADALRPVPGGGIGGLPAGVVGIEEGEAAAAAFSSDRAMYERTRRPPGTNSVAREERNAIISP